MIYWPVAFTWGIIGTIVFWCILSSKWNRLDPFYTRILNSFRVMHPIPGNHGYMDLKFTILRHAFAFLLSATAIYWIKQFWIISIILGLNVLYAALAILRYKARKKDLEETAKRPNGDATASIISIPIKDSFCTVVYSVLCVVLLYVLFLISPYFN